MEITQVKTEPAEENLISEIDIEEHPIKWEPLEDHLYCKDDAGTNSVRNNEEEIGEILKCDMCGISFTCSEILAWHTENCHGIDAIVKVVKISDKEVKYMCWSCNGMFMGLELIVPHLLLHRINNWPFRCNVCKITFMMKHHFTEHGLVCKKNKKRQATSSTVTWRNITNSRNPGERQLDCLLPTHKIDEAVLRLLPKQGKLQSRQCKHCGIKYAHWEMLYWHIEHCHGPDPKIKVLRSDVFGSIYQCVICLVKINTFSSIIQHLFNKHQLSKLPYQCNICQCRQFISKNLLLNHKLICKTTSQVYYNQLQLNDLQQTTKKNSFQEIEDHVITLESEDDLLSLPEHRINSEAALRQYNKKHPARRLECEHCGLKFALREMLKWHIEHCHGPDPKIKVIQNGNNMVVGFKCVFCESEFNHFNLMIQHQRYQHQLSILPFHCNICKCRQFTSNFFLKSHKLMCKKRKLQVDQNIIQMNDDRQSAMKEIACQEIKDHTINKVETGDDQLDLPEHRIIDMELTEGKNLLECRVLVAKLLECVLCYFFTDNKSQLASHMQAHLTPKTSGKRRSRSLPASAAKKTFYHGCSECGNNYSHPEMLAWHSENCHGSDAIVKIVQVKKNVHNYQCVFCKTLCVGLTMMIQHLKNHHRLSNLPYSCNFCDNRYVILTKLNIHQLKCNKNKKDFLLSPTSLMETNSFVKCKMCDDKFKTVEKMRNHVSDFHAVVKDLPFKCVHCQDSFHAFSYFKSHCHKSHPGKPIILQCSVCKSDELTSFQGFKQYEHGGAQFNCKCVAKFRPISKVLMTKSIKKKVRSKMYLQCKYCDAKFKRAKLLNHVRISHRRALHYCQFCMFNTVSKDKLTWHIKNCHLQPDCGKL